MSGERCLSLVFRLTPCPPFGHQYHQLVPYADSAGLHYIRPAHRWCEHCAVLPAFSGTSLAAAMFNDPPPPVSSTQWAQRETWGNTQFL